MYIRIMNTQRDVVRTKVLAFLTDQTEPVRVKNMADELRNSNPELSGLRDSDFLDVVQPMIVTGKIDYTAGLRVQLGRKTT